MPLREKIKNRVKILFSEILPQEYSYDSKLVGGTSGLLLFFDGGSGGPGLEYRFEVPQEFERSGLDYTSSVIAALLGLQSITSA